MDRRGFLYTMGGMLFGSQIIPPTKSSDLQVALFEVGTRSVMDVERELWKVQGKPVPTFAQHLGYYRWCARAVEEGGLDPFEADFWKKANEWIKKHIPASEREAMAQMMQMRGNGWTNRQRQSC